MVPHARASRPRCRVGCHSCPVGALHNSGLDTALHLEKCGGAAWRWKDKQFGGVHRGPGGGGCLMCAAQGTKRIALQRGGACAGAVCMGGAPGAVALSCPSPSLRLQPGRGYGWPTSCNVLGALLLGTVSALCCLQRRPVGDRHCGTWGVANRIRRVPCAALSLHCTPERPCAEQAG